MAYHISGVCLLRWQIFLPSPGPQVWAVCGRFPAAVGRVDQKGPKPGETCTIPAVIEKIRAFYSLGMVLAFRPGLRTTAGTASYPRGVLRGERPKRVLVPFARPKGTPSGERPHLAGKPAPRSFRRTILQSVLHRAGIDAKNHRAGEGQRLLLPDVSYFLVSNPAMLRTGAYSTAATGHTIQVRSQAMVQKLQPR